MVRELAGWVSQEVGGNEIWSWGWSSGIAGRRTPPPSSLVRVFLGGVGAPQICITHARKKDLWQSCRLRVGALGQMGIGMDILGVDSILSKDVSSTFGSNLT
jgi:hypothetical protein